MKQYFCVGSYLPFDSINRSQLNNSKAKQTFSFGKSKRFQDQKANCNIVSYQKNQFKSQKPGVKIGTSKRRPIVIINDFPSPTHYRVKTQAQNNGNSISFGLGRQNLKAYDYLNIDSKNFPSSTKYQISSKFKRLLINSPAYSIKQRFSTENIQIISPGPAKYNLSSCNNRNLQLTKYKSLSFSTSKSKRFDNEDKTNPGPGSYKIVDQTIHKIDSKFASSLGTKFSHSKRKTYIDQETARRLSLPGPGNYRAPSQFGQYDGNIYEYYQRKANNNSFIRCDTQIQNYTANKSLKRPSTSKH